MHSQLVLVYRPYSCRSQPVVKNCSNFVCSDDVSILLYLLCLVSRSAESCHGLSPSVFYTSRFHVFRSALIQPNHLFGRLDIFLHNQKRCKIRPQLLLMTNRKSHTPFRLVWKSTTLDDLGRQLRTLLLNDYSFWQYKVYSDISGGSLGRGRQTIAGLSTTAIFSVLLVISSKILEIRAVIRSPSSAFQGSQNAWPWMTLNG